MRTSHRFGPGKRAIFRRRVRWLMLLAVAFGIGRFALFLSTRNPEPARNGTPELAAGAESLDAAAPPRDWAGAEVSAERLAAEQPRNPEVLCRLALALHNQTIAVTPRFNRLHPSLRLSLDRIAAEMRVLALLDSAARLASSPEQGARALMLRGQAFESLGLPIEALACYRAASERAPKLDRAGLSVHQMTARLAEPRLADSVVEPGPARRAEPRLADSLVERGPAQPVEPRLADSLVEHGSARGGP